MTATVELARAQVRLFGTSTSPAMVVLAQAQLRMFVAPPAGPVPRVEIASAQMTTASSGATAAARVELSRIRLRRFGAASITVEISRARLRMFPNLDGPALPVHVEISRAAMTRRGGLTYYDGVVYVDGLARRIVRRVWAGGLLVPPRV